MKQQQANQIPSRKGRYLDENQDYYRAECIRFADIGLAYLKAQSFLTREVTDRLASYAFKIAASYYFDYVAFYEKDARC